MKNSLDVTPILVWKITHVSAWEKIKNTSLSSEKTRKTPIPIKDQRPVTAKGAGAKRIRNIGPTYVVSNC